MRQHRLREIPPLFARLPGAALDAPCPGYGFTAVCQTVARTDAPASPPGNSTSLRSAPGAALDAPCPGYRVPDVCEPVDTV
ncbi:MAG: hypothetical protein ACLROR_09450, partial [Klebsiella michiganensis]